MPELQRLTVDHADAVLAFELANRDYFSASISDRGDEFFRDFAELFDALVAEQDAGVAAYYVVVTDDGTIMGRFNLYISGPGVANLGYRVGADFAGQGLATRTVEQICRFASSRHELRSIRAATSHENVASRTVLLRAGFTPTGPAGPADLGGRTGTWYQRDLD